MGHKTSKDFPLSLAALTAMLLFGTCAAARSELPILTSPHPPYKISDCRKVLKDPTQPPNGPTRGSPVPETLNRFPDTAERVLASVNPNYGDEWEHDGVKHTFKGIARSYKKWCSAYGVRWDVAFSQMILETNYLRYTGTVPRHHMNFAGIDARTGNLQGEAFTSVESGVKAHCQHLGLYALLDLPRRKCRSVDEKDCLEAQRSIDVKSVIQENACKEINRPATFDDLAPDNMGHCARLVNDAGEEWCACPDKLAWARGCKAPAYGGKIARVHGKILDEAESHLQDCLARQAAASGPVEGCSEPEAAPEPNRYACTVEKGRMAGPDPFCGSYVQRFDDFRWTMHIVNADTARRWTAVPEGWSPARYNTCEVLAREHQEDCDNWKKRNTP